MWQLRMHCKLRLLDVVVNFRTVHAHNCYFSASNQNSDIVVGCSNPDFLNESNNLAIRQRFQNVTLTFDF